MRHVLFLTLLFAVAFLLVRNKIASTPYAYDEADYMFAGTLGIGPNWIDTGTMPLAEFVQAGTRRGSDPQQQSALSALARGSNDPIVYRHWHGPLYYYWLAILSEFRTDERTTRALGLVFPALTAVAMYFGSIFVLGGAAGTLAGMLASILFLCSPITLETTELAPHMLFVLWYVCALLLLAKVAAGGGRRYYYAAAVFAGLAFCTLEVAFVLVLVLLILAWWRRDSLAAGWQLGRNALGFFVAAVLVSWPAGLLKLNFVKAYLVMLYLAVFRKGAWGDVTFSQTWALRFLMSPVEWLLFLAALVLLIVRRKVRPGAWTILLFAALMILATLRVYAEGPRYITPFFAALELFTAWMLASELARFGKPRLSYGALVAIAGLLIWNSHRRLDKFLLREDPRPGMVISQIRANALEHKSILAPRLEIPRLHYYFPAMRVRGYSDVNEIAGERNRGHVDAVLFPEYDLRMEPLL